MDLLGEGLKLVDYENGTIVWEERLAGTGLSLPMYTKLNRPAIQSKRR